MSGCALVLPIFNAIYYILGYNEKVMKINPEIFKAYDIRGLYPSEVNEELAHKLGRAVVWFVAKKLRRKKLTVLVCRDTRTSSVSLKDALIRGVLESGANVIDAGMGSTPFFYFLLQKISPHAGIMVTASHNPVLYNGFKIRGPGAEPIFIENGLKELEKFCRSASTSKKTISGKILPYRDHVLAYLNFLAKSVTVRSDLKVVIDASGGCAALYLPRLLSRFSFIYKPLFFTPSEDFHGRTPNPLLPEVQRFAKEELEKSSFHFGVIFDGDGDRAMFLDELGNPVNPEFIFLLLADSFLKRRVKTCFALTIDTSKSIREYLAEHDAKFILCRRGYPFVRTAMRLVKSPLAVEKSGHFFFREFQYGDSGLLAFLRFADFMSRTRRPLSKIINSLERYVSSGEINFSVKNKKETLMRVARKYRDGKKSKLDGITSEFSDWWFNLRPSNTEPLVRLTLEAKDKLLYEEKMREITKLLTKK